MHGKVSIVGAGPGDPELLTVKARRRIDESDIVYHDALVGNRVVDSIPQSVDVVNVGKTPGGDRTTQETINRFLVAAARRGNAVVRLKGGDPFVFGRGGEEIEFLAAQRIPFEIVPGITSAVGGPGVVGIPLTHREYASSITVVTGHEDPMKDESALDWTAIARSITAGGTLVILMGVRRLRDNMTVLRANGVSRDTPVAMVERATYADEFSVTGTLETIGSKAEDTGIESPAVTIVGDVVTVGERVSDHLAGVSPSQIIPVPVGRGVNQQS